MWKNDQVSQSETLKILETAKKCLTTDGDFVEFGCYRGDTSLMLAEVLRDLDNLTGVGLVENSVEKSVENLCKTGGKSVGNLGKSGGKNVENGAEETEKTVKRRLWLYDSFEGLPEKGEADASGAGEEFVAGALAVSKREVKERFLRAGLPVPVIKKAWFSELTEADLPCEIALAFIDGDFYDSTREALSLVVPRMAPGGVVLVHDYNNPALPGVAKAVAPYLQNRKYQVFETLLQIFIV